MWSLILLFITRLFACDIRERFWKRKEDLIFSKHFFVLSIKTEYILIDPISCYINHINLKETFNPRRTLFARLKIYKECCSCVAIKVGGNGIRADLMSSKRYSSFAFVDMHVVVISHVPIGCVYIFDWYLAGNLL